MIAITKLDEGMLFYIAYQLLSAAVQSMNPPTEKSGGFYSFLYRFLSLIVADYKSFAQRPVQASKVTPSNSATQTGLL